MEPICFYHRADLDGKCSAAIVRKALNGEVELRGYNYGDDFPWEDVRDRDVIMVDCSLQPFSDMVKLAQTAGRLTWIDHHKSAIEEAAKHQTTFVEKSGLPPNGALDTGRAACELTWFFYFQSMKENGGAPMPSAVRLLGRYDVWGRRGLRGHRQGSRWWWAQGRGWLPVRRTAVRGVAVQPLALTSPSPHGHDDCGAAFWPTED